MAKKLAEIKTKENASSVDDFINAIASEEKRNDSFALIKVMEKVSKEKPKMWGGSIIGFGKKIYESPTSGRQVEWFKVGFSPRKANLTVYFMVDQKEHAALFKGLGKYKTSGGCVYINKLADVDLKVVEKISAIAVKAK